MAWLEDYLDESETDDDLTWMRIHLEWTRATPTGTVEDRAQSKLDILNITSGAVDGSFTSGDWTAVDTRIAAWRTSQMDRWSSSYTFAGYKGYQMRFNVGGDPRKPFAETGPPLWVSGQSYAGTGTAGIPYQVSSACTLRTAWPKHWGRCYLPTPGVGDLDAYGRLTSAHRTDVANAMRLLVDDLADADFLTVIPVTQVNKTPLYGLLGVTDVVSDDVPDIQRRRRPKQPAARTVGA